MYQGEGKVLVEEVAQEITHAEVGPASVYQQEPLQVTKLSKGVVWCQNSLHPLLTTDADTDVSGLGGKTQFHNYVRICDPSDTLKFVDRASNTKDYNKNKNKLIGMPWWERG